MPSHELDDADSIDSAERFDVGSSNDFDRGRECALEAKAAIDEVNVVVDRLRNGDHSDRKLAPLDFCHESHGSPQGAVAADDEEHPDPELLQRGHHDRGVLIAARSAERRSALVVQTGNEVRRQLHGPGSESGYQPCVAVSEADDVLDAVASVELEDQTANDVVDPGAKSPARHDAAAQATRLEEDAIAGSRQLERWGVRKVGSVVEELRQAIIEGDSI